MGDPERPPSQRLRLVLVCLSLLALVGGGWLWLRPPMRAALPGPAQSPQAEHPKLAEPWVPQRQPGVAAQTRPRCPMPLLRDWYYNASAALTADATGPKTALRWQVSTRGVRAQADGTTLVAARIALPAGEHAEAAPSGDVTPPFLFRLAADCSHAEYAWRRDADRQGARRQQALVARFAFVLPPQPATPTLADAIDDNGRYRMAAVRRDDAEQTVIHARNLGYARSAVHQRQAVPGGLRIDGPGLRIHLARGGWVESARLEQWLQPLAQAAGAVHLQAELQRAAVGPAMGTIDPDDGGWVWGNLLLDAGLARQVRLRADAELAALDIDAVLAELRAADRNAEHLEALLRTLEAWLLANPRAVGQLQTWLRGLGDGYAGNQWARLALAALGRCGLPAARAALRRLGEDAQMPSALRLHATLNLATAEGVDADDLAWLRRRAAERVPADAGAASQDSTSALSALGIAARQPALHGNPLRQQVVDDLDKALRDPSDPRYLLAAVNGAGNAADPQLLPALLPLAEHADSDIRRRVADAMRAMPAEAVAPLFGPWLAREDAPAVVVQLVAAYAAQYARGDVVPAAVLEPAIARLGSEANAAVALHLVALVGKASAQSEQAKTALIARYQAAVATGDATAAALAQAIGEYVAARALVKDRP